jgi:hypothetical protein
LVAGGVRRRRVRRTRQSTIEEGGVRGWLICRCEEEKISSTVPDCMEDLHSQISMDMHAAI